MGRQRKKRDFISLVVQGGGGGGVDRGRGTWPHHTSVHTSDRLFERRVGEMTRQTILVVTAFLLPPFVDPPFSLGGYDDDDGAVQNVGGWYSTSDD